MSREHSYFAVILKKQTFGEGDELVTLFTREVGKLRVLAKSSKLSRSRLQHALQALFLVELNVAGGKLPKITGARVVESFPAIRERLEAAKLALFAQEVVLRFTADEQPNEMLFEALKIFLQQVNIFADAQEAVRSMLLAKFKIHFLESLGYAVLDEIAAEGSSGFSPSRGGFTAAASAADALPAIPETASVFRQLRQLQYEQVTARGFFAPRQAVEELNHFLSEFLRYHLERDISSEKYLLL